MSDERLSNRLYMLRDFVCRTVFSDLESNLQVCRIGWDHLRLAFA